MGKERIWAPRASAHVWARDSGPTSCGALIGIGGMGEVYRAYDTVRERMVALKLLRTDVAADPSYQDRFRRESRIAARLQEPHVIPVHDFGEIDGVLYIDMRLVEGASVKDELRVNGALPPARTVSIITQVAAALDAAHANGLVHRDIKPENVLLTPDDFAYLVDFGIAYGGGEASVTKTGLVIGSCAYMATERLSGKPGGPASDVYSLTCLLHECLTGRAPFEAGDLRQVMSAHMFAPPPRPSVVRRGISPAFDDVVAKGMAKNPADRYASAGELARAAADAAHGRPAPVAAVAPPSPPQSTRQFAPRSRADRRRATCPTRRRRRPRRVTQAAVQSDAEGAAGRDDRHVRAGGGAGWGDRHDRRRWRLRAAEPAGRTATVDDDGHHDGTVRFRGDDFVRPRRRRRRRHRPARAPSPACRAPMRRASSVIRRAATRAARPRRRSGRRTRWPIVCETAPGSYYYRGERLSDGAQLQLANAVPAGGGFDAVNPADGSRYQVRPDQLTISSSRGSETDPALEYGTGQAAVDLRVKRPVISAADNSFVDSDAFGTSSSTTSSARGSPRSANSSRKERHACAEGRAGRARAGVSRRGALGVPAQDRREGLVRAELAAGVRRSGTRRRATSTC